MQNKAKGNKGELIATKYLQDKGYDIVENNYRCKYGEIDIIVKDKDYIVFVEVKYRTSINYGMPVEAVDSRKQTKIREVATNYIIENNIKSKVRIDVIGILNMNKIEINHIVNAF